jgi:hypothetical protein
MWVHGAADMSFALGDMVKYHPYTAMPGGSLLPLAPTDADYTLRPRPRAQLEREEKEKLKKKVLIKGFKPLVAQMMSVESTFDVNQANVGKSNPEGSSLLVSKPKDSINPELFCVGELVNNIRPYTRRFGFETAWSSPTFPGRITLDPAYFWESTFPGVTNNPLNYFSRMYVFYRGGVRYKLFFTSKGTLNTGQQWTCAVASSNIRSGSPEPYTTVPADTTSFIAGRFLHRQYLDLNPVVEITCPYYSNVPIQILSKVYLTDLHQRMRWKTFNSTDPTAAGDTGLLYKAAGDDFSFGYLVGAPLLVDTGEA